MESLKKIKLEDFTNNLGLKLEDSLKETFIKNLKLYKKSKKLVLEIESNEVVKKEELNGLIKNIKMALKRIKTIEINVNYTHNYKSLEELIDSNWCNFIYIFKREVPACKAIEDQICWEIKNDNLIIKVTDSIILEKLVERNVKKIIQEYLYKNFNVLIDCNFISDKNNIFDLSIYEETKEKENILYINKLKEENNDFAKKSLNKNGDNGKKSDNNDTLLGKNISGSPISINNINNDIDIAIIEGEVFDIDSKELNSGKILTTIQITDYDNSMTVKVFEDKDRLYVKENLKVNNYIKIQGRVVYDKYLRENIIIANNINFSQKKERKDLADEKRVELHLHTKMSSMDGLSSATELISTVAKWGHKAIAITDHGVVQAFPEAMEISQKLGIKVIYGMEGYFVNDEENLIEIDDNLYSLDDEFIVFDIETTGLSNINDKITEIGAIKIKNGKIVDSFSTLVNPEIPIPEKITELTGIDDSMVINAPRIQEVLPQFLKFVGKSPLVAHNAKFDVGFIRENAKALGVDKINNVIVDTLALSRVLLTDLKRYRLNNIAKELNVVLENHHRAVDDAKATADIFIKLINMMKEKNIFYLQDINKVLGKKIDVKKLNTNHIVLLAKNQKGLYNLYKIVSESHLNYFHRNPRIPKSLLDKYREGILVGSACESGELFQAILNNQSPETIEEIVKYYDYLEVQPLGNNEFLIDKGMVRDFEEIKEINKKIVELGNKYNIPVVATGDVHFLNKRDEYFRRILMAGQGFSDADNQAPLYFKTTDEMLEEFSYLGEKKAREVVIDNTIKISDSIDNLLPIPNGTFPPEIEGSDEELRRLCYENAWRIYGKPLPDIVQKRLDREVNSIIDNGYAVMYIIAQKLVSKSLSDGYLVGSRGSVGSSFAATMSNITEVNPLPPHYVCPKCKYSKFITDGSYGSGVDMPDKNCPKCDTELIKDGHDIPFEVFLGFEADKEPDIDLNFAGEYQSEAHKYTEELFGEGKVYRAGTIGTIADKTAYGFVKKYLEEKDINCTSAEINRLTIGCSGVKRTTGQHPGGVMIVPADRDIHEFTPIQYPANDINAGVITTHFDYHSISGRLLKLDILGHDVPTIIKMLEDITNVNAQSISLSDKKTMSLFTGIEALNIKNDAFDIEVGTLGIPEFGTKFVRQMLIDTKPSTFAELVRISGLSHGTDVWLNNAQDLVRSGTAELKDVISTRDDIMNYLILKGIPSITAFKIMENVRKGKGLSPEDEEIMRSKNIPEWYIDSCNKIKYMFPKAHAVAYVMMSFRIAYFKVYFPEAFYATYFSMKAEDFDTDLIIKGIDVIKNKILEIENLGNNATAKERNLLTVLEVALEMYCRGIELLPVDLYKSDADKFIIKEDKLLPPLKSLQGVGQNAARSIQTAREEGKFISIEDLRERTKVTKTVIETLKVHGCLEGMSESNQLSLF